MTSTNHKPRLVVAVGNGITGDSRVQKTAIAAARDGWDVYLIGSTTGDKIEESAMGPIHVIKVPVGNSMRKSKKGRPLRRYLTQFRIADSRTLTQRQIEFNVWARRVTAKVGWLRQRSQQRLSLEHLAQYAASYALGFLVRVRRKIHSVRVRAFKWEQRHSTAPTGSWRKDWPILLDIDLAFGPLIEEIEPDVIHANDTTMIVPAFQAAGRLRAKGKRVSWLYDVHEYVRGVEWPTAAQASAFKAVEREFILRADAVVTVSPQIAKMLQEAYRLSELPTVVGNTPIQSVIANDTRRASVRTACGLGPRTPLVVYAGWVAENRGLRTMIEALPKLPDLHFAIVVGRSNSETKWLLDRAKALDVGHRVHIVPYVPQHQVADYLSSADLGLIPLLHAVNHEISLPTKVAEYLHAGLPLVASDVKVMGEFVDQQRVGAVFAAGNADSLVDAIDRALSARATIVANISPQLLKQLSWEEQSSELLRLYRALSGAVMPEPASAEVSWTIQESCDSQVSGITTMNLPSGPKPLARTKLLGIGPANYAGQASAFASALTAANPDISTEVFMRRSSQVFVYPADIYLDPKKLNNLDVQIGLLQRIVGRYTHLIADAFLPVFGHLNGDNIEHDLPALSRAGIKVALLAHGSEIRHPVRHLARNEYSLFHDAPEGMAENLTKISERNQRVADESGLPLFVTTPDLLDDLPKATWAPLVVDLVRWRCDRPVMERKRPVVLHGPSKRWTKGTDRILPLLTNLHDRKVITLRLAENIAWSEMKNWVHDADIVVDQFGTGSYGTFAVEAMAAGKPVVAYLSPMFDRVLDEPSPVVNATPVTLKDAIESLLDDPIRTAEIGVESRNYVQKYHNGQRTAAALDAFLKI